MSYQGRHLFIDGCLGEGANVMFGNPGTSEVPIIDALVDRPSMQYVLCQHEAVAVMCADAYAQITGQASLVNLHIGPGLGNAIGSIYNSYERGTPMVVTCGQTDTRMRLREPMTSHDLVAMARPVTEWAVQVERIEELPLVLHRAFKTAREASGPVFVSLPMNVMDEPTELRPLPPSRIFTATLPDPDAVAEAVRLLEGSKCPAIVVGDRVARGGASAAVLKLAETLVAPVFFETLPAHMNLPFCHPLVVDRLPVTARMIHDRLKDFDAFVLIGGEFFEEAFYATGDYFPAGVPIVQIDISPACIGRNFSVACGIVASIAEGVSRLAAGLGRRPPTNSRLSWEVRKGADQEAHVAKVEALRNSARLTSTLALDAIARAAPDDAHIATEVHLETGNLLRSVRFTNPAQFLSARAGGIGQAFPSGIGAKLAMPQRPVIAISGDGSALYTPQALWTAARLGLDIVFIVLNNRAYRILSSGMSWYRADFGIDQERPLPHFDLSHPAIDFVAIAAGFGVKGQRISTVAELDAVLCAGWATSGPRLLELMVE